MTKLLLTRSCETIKAITSTKDLDLDEFKVKNMSQKVKSADLLSPLSFNLIFNLILATDKISVSENPKTFVTIFEVLLVYALLFAQDQDSRVAIKMLKQANKIIKTVQTNLEAIDGNELIMSRIVNSPLIRWISSGLNFNLKQINSRKDQIV